MRLAHLLVGCLPILVLAQTSPSSSVTKSPGEIVTLEISARSQPDRAPIALHWEVTFPAQLMQMDGDPEAGPAAVSSGKSLGCRSQNPYSYTCVLSGKENPIADGQIAIFHFRILATAKTATTALKIEKAVAVSSDSKIVSLNDTQVTVVIR
jgi:hypothetical protein